MNNAARERLDIVIPVYNEGDNIVATLRAIARDVKTSSRVLICYDREEDDTLPAITNNRDAFGTLSVEFVRNRKRGAHAAVLTGFARSDAPFVLVFPADDDYNRAARYMAWKSAHYMDKYDSEGQALGGMSKTFCGDLMQTAVFDCMRVVGVNALDRKFPMEKFYRESIIFPLYDAGSLAMQRRRALSEGEC